MYLRGILISAAAITTSYTTFTSAFGVSPLTSRRDATTLYAKKILLAFDGTGNNARRYAPNAETDKSLTNVLRLHLLAGGDINGRRNDIEGQICLYERGIGAKSRSIKLQKLRRKLGDLRKQTEPMRKRLEEVYEPGDKLYLIGFSRGASAARNFAVKLNSEGLKTKDGEKVESPPIEFLGCFDTVSSQVQKNLFGILRYMKKELFTPSTVLGEDGKVAPNVKLAVHNVALDDNRQFKFFPPVLMGAEDRVHEAWFPGEHQDAGGGYYTKGIPDCSCVYMKEWLESLGEDSLKFIKAVDINEECLKIDDYPDIKISAADLTLTPDPSDRLHFYEDCQVKTDDFTPSYRLIHVLKNDEKVEGATVNIHESVLLHMEAMKAKGTPCDINPNLKKTKIAVIGSLGKVLDDETKRLQALLDSDY